MVRHMSALKPIRFHGSALEDLRGFPADARREAGHQLDLLQRGEDPDDWKPMTTIGAGVREVRIREDSGAFRVIYVAKFTSAIHVLHCFQKTTQRTAKPDLECAERRYRQLLQELS
jgi:phage-related protein